MKSSPVLCCKNISALNKINFGSHEFYVYIVSWCGGDKYCLGPLDEDCG